MWTACCSNAAWGLTVSAHRRPRPLPKFSTQCSSVVDTGVGPSRSPGERPATLSIIRFAAGWLAASAAWARSRKAARSNHLAAPICGDGPVVWRSWGGRTRRLGSWIGGVAGTWCGAWRGAWHDCAVARQGRGSSRGGPWLASLGSMVVASA
eukprot:7218665-Prymnesium_polylepis.2